MINKKDIMSYNDKNKQHGLWKRYYANGNLWYKRFYQNSKEVGYEEYYYVSGKLLDKKYNL